MGGIKLCNTLALSLSLPLHQPHTFAHTSEARQTYWSPSRPWRQRLHLILWLPLWKGVGAPGISHSFNQRSVSWSWQRKSQKITKNSVGLTSLLTMHSIGVIFPWSGLWSCSCFVFNSEIPRRGHAAMLEVPLWTLVWCTKNELRRWALVRDREVHWHWRAVSSTPLRSPPASY